MNATGLLSEEEAAVPVRLTIEYPERMSRWLLFFKWLFVIPLYFITGIWGIATGVVLFISFFAILFAGRFPRPLFDFVFEWYRFATRVSAYFPYFLVDKWWPDEGHPLQLEVEYPEKLSRGILLLKFLSGLMEVASSLAGTAVFVITILALPAWFIILFTARYPREVYSVAVTLFQWSTRVYAWQYLLRDEWSLFGTTRTVRIWVLVGVIGLVALFFLQVLFQIMSFMLTTW